MEEKYQELVTVMKIEKDKLEEETKKLEFFKKSIKLNSEERFIKLNVGGKIFCTTSRTLGCKVPDLQGNLTNQHFLAVIGTTDNNVMKDNEGNYFIDRNGEAFGCILEYLRNEGNCSKVIFPSIKKKLQAIKIEANYYGLFHLEKWIDDLICPPVDELMMIIHTTYFRDQYTVLSKAEVIGKDGKNYGLNEHCTYTCSSTYPGFFPSNLGSKKQAPIVYHHFNNLGKKFIKWK